MKQIALALALAFLVIPSSGRAQQSTTSSTRQVGTYDRTSIVLAYYRSPLWAAILADRRFELETVKTAHDEPRAKELEKWGQEAQDRAMHQLSGDAAIDNILAVLQPEFREVTGRLSLSGIVDATTVNAGVDSVDVTPQLMDWLRASSETRKMAMDLRLHHEPGK
jgi:hypothetical protein